MNPCLLSHALRGLLKRYVQEESLEYVGLTIRLRPRSPAGCVDSKKNLTGSSKPRHECGTRQAKASEEPHTGIQQIPTTAC